MIRKVRSAQSGYVQIIFELPACLWADHIYVVGEFNHWDKRNLPMAQERDGTWRLVLDLPVDHSFEFRYLVDGRWLTDNHADAIVDNAYGSQNSVVRATLPLLAQQVATERSLH